MAMTIFLNHNLNVERFHKKSSLNSFRAFLLSIFIYSSIFYIFNLSPSTLVHTTKFWFFLSNTLILIIAADSRTFPPSPSSKDLDSFAENNVTLPCSFHTKQYKTTPSKHHEQQPPEKIIGVVAAQKKRRRRNEAGVMDEEFHSKKMKEENDHGLEMEEEDDEFSRMSDEEVNRRVEEFIRMFNRQIRVQAAINRRQLG